MARSRTEAQAEATPGTVGQVTDRKPAFVVPDLLRIGKQERETRGWSGWDLDELRLMQAVAELGAQFSRQDPDLLSRCPAVRDVVWWLARWTEDWEDMQ